ncbi:MAG: MerR family transcriptional regulator [Myxococcota bacterium]
MEHSAGQDPPFTIGAVARLTGLSVNTIRTWERRYEAVRPARDEAGRRSYRSEDIARLKLLRALSQRGESVRQLARLTTDALDQRLQTHRASSPVATHASSRDLPGVADDGAAKLLPVALVHPELQALYRAYGRSWPFQAVYEADHLDAFRASFDGMRDREPVALLLVELARLGPVPADGLADLQRITGARHTIVTYDFAPTHVRRDLSALGARMRRGPVDPTRLDADVASLLAFPPAPNAPPPVPSAGNGDPAPRRFDDLELARLRGIASDVACECPQQLATVVCQLVAFEAYSERCIRTSPEDAALHRALLTGTAGARERLEQLLQRVCEHDGIPTRRLG